MWLSVTGNEVWKCGLCVIKEVWPLCNKIGMGSIQQSRCGLCTIKEVWL